jgi:hypothetical protein
MSAYADTGIVVTLYKEENTSAVAVALMAERTDSVRLSKSRRTCGCSTRKRFSVSTNANARRRRQKD